MAILTNAKFHFSWLMATLIFGIRAYNVCSVHWGMFSTSGGYHDACGGYNDACGGNIMSTWDVQYIGVFNINQRLLLTCYPT